MKSLTLKRLALSGMVAGGLALTACEDSTSSKSDKQATITSAKTLAEFQSACTTLKGTLKTHDCQAMNECKGHSYQEGKGVASHDCQGKSSCKGASCVES